LLYCRELRRRRLRHSQTFVRPRSVHTVDGGDRGMATSLLHSVAGATRRRRADLASDI